MIHDGIAACAAAACAGVVALAASFAWLSSLPTALPPRAVASVGATPDATGGVLVLDGESALQFPLLRTIDPPFTAECWFRATSLARAATVFGNTDDGGFEVVLRDERNDLDGIAAWLRTTRTVRSREPGWTVAPAPGTCPVDRWTHVALVVADGRMRLFVDGRIESDTAVLGRAIPSAASFTVGGDTDDRDAPADCLVGELDVVRVSLGARYTAPFVPATRLDPDADTALLLTFDDARAPFADSGPMRTFVRPVGSPSVR